MSSPTLTTIQTQITLYANSIVVILGDIGNIFIIIIFLRQHQNTCSMYLISAAIFNTLYLTFNRLVQIYPFYYRDETIRAFFLCKIRSYLPTVIGQIAKTMVVFACIDRYMITSEHANFRAFSTPKRAKYFILFSIIFWTLFASHIAIMSTIVNGQCVTSGIYSTIFSIFVIIFIGSAPPITMGICVYLTYRNMKRIHGRIQPVINTISEGNSNIRQRDRDLLIIVVNEVFLYVLTASLYPLILMETMITTYTMSNKSALHLQIETFILNIAYLLLFVNSGVPFYIYLLLSKSFRRDFKQLFIYIYRKLTRQTQVTTLRRASRAIERNTGV
ncbi:unnamed protein product [Adineta steineri]|uniref:G-protein coupled receptors family 1 profile domain-containing protein n=1 Tax=Adineta steineri TaxID=433720 RepID=A0A819LK56_9BILA|nr:unnamed protein product [Adineta steineri]CAF0787484.1 unnamed protein product [Adineta steineri]CAF3489256.1 unnamed protein product [Adineta steineri]CAF3968277.1 unnamed protein product [Adineta steineri]